MQAQLLLRATVVFVAVLMACACARQGVMRHRYFMLGNRGQISDVTLKPGRYDGYDITPACPRWSPLDYRHVVRGHGSLHVAETNPKAGWNDAMVELRARMEQALEPYPVVVWYWSSGCYHQGYALAVEVLTYGYFDPVMKRVGAVLREQELGEDVEIVLYSYNHEDNVAEGGERRAPLARRAFFPYEFAVTAGALQDSSAWRQMLAAHVGVISGREGAPPSTAGWFWGFGVDARAQLGQSDAPWSAGPSVRLGWALGALADDKPEPQTNRGTYVYTQANAELGPGGLSSVLSFGATSLALGEYALANYNKTDNLAYLLWLPLATLNHVEAAWVIDPVDTRLSRFALLAGFSL